MEHGLIFNIFKTFGRLELTPTPEGLGITFAPVDSASKEVAPEPLVNIVLPISSIGGLWATTRAFLNNTESLDENIVLKSEDIDVLVRLYRDKPQGSHHRYTGDENCWLRLVTGRSEKHRHRIKLSGRDLWSLDLACQTVMTMTAGRS